jgi:Zn-finger domain-containing protein
MSPKSMGKLLDEIGVDHDGKLKEWKDNIQDYFSNIITLQKTLETLKSHKAAVEKEKLEPVIVKGRPFRYMQ